jgi:SAM-dependent methyltransferase
MKRLIYPVLAILLLPAAGFPFGGQEIFDIWQRRYIVPGSEVVLDVPYVQTEDYIVEQIMSLAEVGSGDVLYDLGCGDGRIVIRAAKNTGVRGVGIDIDHRRIAESKSKAIAAQVADRTLFLQQDLFDSDIRDATVVTLYLLPEINLKLRPKLFRDLRPGTRIVSHNFDMGDWKADKKVYAGLWLDGFHYLFFWVLPANASGFWQGPNAGESWSLSIRQRFQNIEGSLSVKDGRSLPLSEATLTGDMIRFTATDGRSKRSITFNGKVDGNLIEGVFREEGPTASPWKATRDPATVSSIQ